MCTQRRHEVVNRVGRRSCWSPRDERCPPPSTSQDHQAVILFPRIAFRSLECLGMMIFGETEEVVLVHKLSSLVVHCLDIQHQRQAAIRKHTWVVFYFSVSLPWKYHLFQIQIEGNCQKGVIVHFLSGLCRCEGVVTPVTYTESMLVTKLECGDDIGVVRHLFYLYFCVFSCFQLFDVKCLLRWSLSICYRFP